MYFPFYWSWRFKTCLTKEVPHPLIPELYQEWSAPSMLILLLTNIADIYSQYIHFLYIFFPICLWLAAPFLLRLLTKIAAIIADIHFFPRLYIFPHIYFLQYIGDHHWPPLIPELSKEWSAPSPPPDKRLLFTQILSLIHITNNLTHPHD